MREHNAEEELRSRVGGIGMGDDAKVKDGMIELDFGSDPGANVEVPAISGERIEETGPDLRLTSDHAAVGSDDGGGGLDLSLVFNPGDLGAGPRKEEPMDSPELNDATAIEKNQESVLTPRLDVVTDSLADGAQGTAQQLDLSRIELLDMVSVENRPLETSLAEEVRSPPPILPTHLEAGGTDDSSMAPPPLRAQEDSAMQRLDGVSESSPIAAPATAPVDESPSQGSESESTRGDRRQLHSAVVTENSHAEIPEATSVGLAPSIDKSKRTRAVVMGVLGLAAAGVLFAVYGLPEIGELLGSKDEVSVVAEPGAVEAAPNGAKAQVPAPDSAKTKKKSKASTETLSAVPLAQPTPGKSYLQSRNRDYFGEVDSAILSGNPVSSMRAFRRPMAASLTPEEKIVAAEFEARYYLMIGKPTRASDVLAPFCQNVATSQPSACIHFVRALISSEQAGEARALLLKIKGQQTWETYNSLLVVCEKAIAALTSPTEENLRNFVNHTLGDLNVNPEWYRQRTAWLARALYDASRADRISLARHFLGSKREMLMMGLRNAERAGATLADPLLASLFNRLAVQAELPMVTRGGVRASTEIESSLVALAFALVAQAPFESAHLLNSAASTFTGSVMLGEMGRLIAANVELNEGNVQRAWAVYTQEYPNLAKKKSRFLYEWTLVFARCISEGMGTETLGRTLEGVVTSLHGAVGARADFFHWLTVAKLERVMRKKSGSGLNKAMALAATPHERALVGVEEARRLAALGRPREAAAVIQKWARQYSDDGFILQAAAEMAPLGNYDPAPFLDRLSRLPEKLASRNVEYPLLSDVTLRRLISLL